MNREVFKQLVLKEYYTWIWAVTFGMFLLGGFTAIALKSRLIPDINVLAIVIMMGVVNAMICGMSPIGSERKEGTLRLLQLLPIPVWQVLFVKLLVGSIGVAVPILFSGIIFSVMTAGREIDIALIYQCYACGVFTTIIALVWTVCLGIKQPNEVRVGMVAILALFLIFVGVGIFDHLDDQKFNLSQKIIKHMTSLSPIGTLVYTLQEQVSHRDRFYLIESVVCNLIILVLMFVIAAWRLNQPTKTRG